MTGSQLVRVTLVIMNITDDVEAILPTVSHAMACKAIQTVLTYLEQQPSTPMGTVVTLNGLLTEASIKRLMNPKQNKINFAKV